MKRVLFALAFAGTLLGGAAAQDRPALVFTAIPDQDETRLVERFTKVAEYLQARLGTPMKYLPVKSYPATVAAFSANQVQLAWFGGFTGVQARRQVPGSEAIAQGAEDVAFRSFIIANSKTGLTASQEFPKAIAGKSFTFGSRASTSGRLMPEYFIRKEFGGRAPDEIFSRVGFSGDHSRTIQLVQSGAFEIGVLDYTVWDLDSKAGKVEPSQVQVIWESPTYPDYQWTVRGDVDQRYGAGFKEKLRAALLAIDDPAILAQFARSRFIPAKNSDYAPIEEVAKVSNLLN
ncbi:MAG: putative selenate ABC transporter substrate-binding protein [Xanthobacteraceae bacterium]